MGIIDTLPSGANGEESTCQCRRHKRCRFHPWVGKIPWSRAWQPTPVFLLGKSEKPGGLQSIGLQRVRHDWSDLARMYALWTEYCWLTMLRQFQVEAKGLSHTYSYTHSPPTFPPIQTVTELIFVFVSLFINVILVCKIPDLQKSVHYPKNIHLEILW